MRRRFIRVIVALALAAGATLAFASSSGPPSSRTGAPAVPPAPAEGLCTQCHNTFFLDVNDPRGRLEILDVPEPYVPGRTYPIRVRLAFEHSILDTLPYKWGFQLTAVQANNGIGAGAFDAPTPDVRILTPGSGDFETRRYVEQTSAGTHIGESGPVEWTFRWTAPLPDSGDVYFFASGNAANGNLGPEGDYIFTAADTAHEATDVGVPGHGPPLPHATDLGPPHPNPFTRFAAASFSVARPGRVDLAVFDLQGRRVRRLRSGWHPGGTDALTWRGDRDDGSQVPDGIYFLRLKVEGERSPAIRKIIRSR